MTRIPQRLLEFREAITGLNPDQQSIPYSSDSWKNLFQNDPDVNSIVKRFLESISRENVKALGAEAVRDTNSVRRFFIAVMMWGYGTTAYGPYRVKRMLDNRSAEGILRDTLQRVLSGDIQAAYRDFALRGCGPSFMTKYLYFIGLSLNVRPLPLILDSRVAQSLKSMDGDDSGWTEFIKCAVGKRGSINVLPYPDGYIRYIETMDQWAKELGCRADAIELFLFDPPQGLRIDESRRDTDVKQQLRVKESITHTTGVTMQKIANDVFCQHCRLSIKKLKEMSEVEGNGERIETFGRQSFFTLHKVDTEEGTVVMRRSTKKLTALLKIDTLIKVHDLIHSGAVGLDNHQIDEVAHMWGNYLAGLLRHLGCRKLEG